MSKLVERAQRILMSPKTEWPIIAAEPDTVAGIYRNYLLVLAAIGPVALFLKSTLIGSSLPFLGTLRVPLGMGLVQLVLGYVLSLGAVYVFALIINALAPTFGGQKDSVQAFKTAAYAMTASWIAGVAQILPFIGILVVIAGVIYGVYVLFLGLPVTMKSPPDKTAGYTAVACIAAVILFWVLATVVGAIVGRGMMRGHGLGGSTVGGGAFEQGTTGAALEEWAKKIEEASKQLEQSAAQNEGGAPSAEAMGQFLGSVMGGGKGGEALPAEQIKTYLPETLAGLPRTEFSAQRNAAMGIQISEASADYSDGAGRKLRLEIRDSGGAQGFVALATWAQVEQEREWQGGYERDYRAGGRMIHERWDSSSGRGEYGVVVGKRFTVQVSGKAANIDELKAALTSGVVDLAALETLAAKGSSN